MKTLWLCIIVLFASSATAAERVCGEDHIPMDMRHPPSVDYHVFYLDQPMVRHLCLFDWSPEPIWGCAAWQMEDPELWHIYIDEAVSEADKACILLHEQAHLPPNNWVHRGLTNEIPGSMFRRVKPADF